MFDKPKYCVVAIQEEGSEIYIERDIESLDDAVKIKERATEDYPEFRNIWIEKDPCWVAMREMYMDEEDY